MTRRKPKDTTPPAIHRPQVKRGADTFGKAYWLVCTCGETGKNHAARRLAQVDLDKHLLSLPRVPAAQQCKDPARHDRRSWEPCITCAGQVPLFDLAEVSR